MSVKPWPTPLQNANASLALAFFPGWHRVCSQVPPSSRSHSRLALYMRLLLETCGPLKGSLRRSPWTTGRMPARDLLARLYLREFFAPVSWQRDPELIILNLRPDYRITGPLCALRDEMRGGGGSPWVIQPRHSVITPGLRSQPVSSCANHCIKDKVTSTKALGC